MSNKREALEAAKDWITQASRGGENNWLVKKIEAALAEPEQEPASSQRDAIVVNLVRNGINKHDARELANHFISMGNTSPQPREWQELSESEIEKICHTGPVYSPNGLVIRQPIEYRDEIKSARLAGVRQASAALRAKNGG